jgi:hypothetical protein
MAVVSRLRGATGAGEALIGIVLWYGARAWGLLIGAVLLLAPVELAVVVGSLTDASAGLSLLAGTIGAAALGLVPWTGESWPEGAAALASIGLSWIVWQLTQEPDVSVLALAACATVGATAWVARRVLHAASESGQAPGSDAQR